MVRIIDTNATAYIPPDGSYAEALDADSSSVDYAVAVDEVRAARIPLRSVPCASFSKTKWILCSVIRTKRRAQKPTER
jgi:hypothetical protein